MKRPKAEHAVLPWIGYIRVSTREQADSGLSLSSQEEKVRAQATVKGVTLAEVIVDAAESAKSLDRPGVQRLMDQIRRREVAGVIVAKLDRLTRSLLDLCELVRLMGIYKVALASCAESFDTGNASGRMILNIIGTIAQWERETISERTRDALAQKSQRGEHAGTVKYGYRSTGRKKLGGTGHIIADPTEARIIQIAQQRRAAGDTLASIAWQLNQSGYRTRRGTEFRVQYVDSILRANA